MLHETLQAGCTGHPSPAPGLVRGARRRAARWLALGACLALGFAGVSVGLGQAPEGPSRSPFSGAGAGAAVPVALQPRGGDQPGLAPPPRPIGGFNGDANLPRPGNVLPGYHPRLEALPEGVKSPVGTTPQPTPEQNDLRFKHERTFIDPMFTMEMILGRPRLWYLKDVPFRIQVADESILQYTIIGNTPNELSLLGQRVGSTVMNVWFGNPNDPAGQTVLSYLVNVLPDPEAKKRLERIYKALEDEINQVFCDSYVCLFLVGDKLVVSGQIKDAIEHQKIFQILRAQAPGGQQGAGGPGAPGGAATVPLTTPLSNQYVIGPDGQPQMLNALDQYIIHGEQNIVDMTKIPGEQQVMLRVVVAEVNRDAARSIGLNWSITNRNGIRVFADQTGTVAANLPALLDNGRIPLQIEALRAVHLARSLAEPNLTTLNGRPAFFFAGGQFPIPIITGATAVGLQGVSFVPFGVFLNFVPLISDKDKIRLQVNATVSTRNNTLGSNFGTGNIGNTFVPGLNARTVTTTVEMREGQTLAIGGLLQTNMGADTTRVPLIGDLPLIGHFTGAAIDHVSSGESELVLMVTPELVHPLEPKEIPPVPGSDMFEPGDLEFYLLGRIESNRPYDYRSQVMDKIGRMCAYRHCELQYFVGPSGHCDPPGIPGNTTGSMTGPGSPPGTTPGPNGGGLIGGPWIGWTPGKR